MSGKQKPGGWAIRLLRRLLLVMITAAVLVCAGAWVLLRQVFLGPSPAARELLAASMLERENTAWIPGLFLDEKLLEELQNAENAAPTSLTTNPALITVAPDAEFWDGSADGIRVESYAGDSFTAHILLIRDPERLYLAHASADTQIATQMAAEQAVAAIYAAEGDEMAISRGVILQNTPVSGGFVGMNREHVLMIAGGMTEEEANELNLRDGCVCGMTLICNGQINEGAYNANSGCAPRVCLGQRGDGTIVLLTIDGLSTNSIGGTYRNCIDILYEYGCVNACTMEDAPAAMLCGDTMVHGESVPRAEITASRNFWMVQPGKGA